MDVLYERCCGLDIHKKVVVACLITPGSKGAPNKEVRSFGTMTGDLLQLGDWLEEHGVTRGHGGGRCLLEATLQSPEVASR